MKKIVCVGGGTGTFVALSGLKQYEVNLKAVVSMADSGGSNKRIRDEFGLLPTSDIRQCLVALAEESSLMRELFMYRFEKGNGIKGMTFGNLFLAALTDIVGSQQEALKKTSEILNIRGEVIPSTLTDTHLEAEYENGLVVSTEHLIDEPEHDANLKIVDLRLTSKAQLNEDACDALLDADLIVVGPGDLYTSIVPNFLVDGFAECFAKSKAKKVYVMNLMTKFGQTNGYSATDHLNALLKYAGGVIDYVIVNSGEISKEALEYYENSENDKLVVNDLGGGELKVVLADVINRDIFIKSKSDNLTRSLIRHDSVKLAKVIMSLL